MDGSTWELYCDIWGEENMEGEVRLRIFWGSKTIIKLKKDWRHAKSMELFDNS